MTIAVDRLPTRILPKWNFLALPHPLCCDSSSDSETDSVFDLGPGNDYSCESYSGGYSPRLKVAAILPVVATESATGNFLAATTADTLLLELMEQDSGAAPSSPPSDAVASSGAAATDGANCMPRMAADAPKCREVRVNSDFLRQYALDYSARLGAVLPVSDDVDEITRLTQTPALKQFDAKYGLVHISSLSKEKLWHSVVLEPREDARPNKSIVTQPNRTAAAPLVLLRPLQLPAGVLGSARHIHHSSDWCTMSTFTQYTRKGWCDERWATVT